MSRAKQALERKRRRKALPVLGAAGLSFSLVSGASGGPTVNLPTPNTGASHEITLAEEEISDVSLATFYVFDKENAGTFRPNMQLVRGGGCGGGGCGGGGCRGCGGGGGCRGCGGGGGFGRGCAYGGFARGCGYGGYGLGLGLGLGLYGAGYPYYGYGYGNCYVPTPYGWVWVC
jgi:hypothetical protein